MGEIETEVVRRDEAAFLRHMPTQPLAQRRMEQMRGAVVGARGVAPFGIDRLVQGFTDRQLAFDYRDVQHMQPSQWLGSVLYFAFEAFERS